MLCVVAGCSPASASAASINKTSVHIHAVSNTQASGDREREREREGLNGCSTKHACGATCMVGPTDKD